MANHVEWTITREGAVFQLAGIRVVVAHARGGKVVLGTPLQDEAGPLTDEQGLRNWAAETRKRIDGLPGNEQNATDRD